MRGTGRALFVAILLLIAGTLNTIYGFGAIGNAHFESLLSVGGTHPWWSLAIFALCVCILHGLVIYGGDEKAAPRA
jgi:hypothetical protein